MNARSYPFYMEVRYTIGQLAKAAGVPTTTVRYYERRGLLRPAGRTPHNYRYYGGKAVEQLRFIRAAQTSGFTLDDIAALLRLRDRSAPPCEEVRGLIHQRLDDVERHLRDLGHVRDVLRNSLRACRDEEADDLCRVLEGLRSGS